MNRLYDFGTDASNIGVNERRALAWPVAVWSCYIPESDLHDVNILEGLILKLVKNGFSNIEDILNRKLGFNKDLVDAAIEGCENKGYFDRRHKDLTLSKDGESILSKYENPYSDDLEMSQNTKKIYMIQDLVTKSVVPVFDITTLPNFYLEDDTAIKINYQLNDDVRARKPRSASIKTALRYWARLCNNRRLGIDGGAESALNLAEDEQGTLEQFIPFEDEVAWDSSDEIVSMADKEEADQKEKTVTEVNRITILDDYPEIYYARGYIAINRNAPDEIVVVSPFGNRMNEWFRTVINRLRANDSEFNDEIELFLMEKREELKDVIAFSNDLNIALFDRFPFISNDSKFLDLKRAIEGLTRTKERIVAGEDETHNFTDNRATALQIALRHLFDTHTDLFIKKMDFSEYKVLIQELVNTYGFDSDIEASYKKTEILSHALSCKIGTGHITGYSALLLIDAWKNKSGKSMDLLKAMPEFPMKIFEITRPRNTSTHGNIGYKNKKGYADMYISEDEAIQMYSDFENMLIALYTRFMEE